MPRTTAQAVILDILRNADGEWSGKTKLFKAFYFAHLYYANEHPTRLTDWPIARMAQGPGIHDANKLFDELVREGLLTIENIHEGPYPEYRYRLTEKGQGAHLPPETARQAIRLATAWCSLKTGSELSRLTHEASRSWREGKDGDILDIYIDLIPDDEYERQQEIINSLTPQIGHIFSGDAHS